MASALPLISLASLRGGRIARIGVGPCEIEDRIGEGAAFLLVQLFQAEVELRHDPGVALRLARRRRAWPMPLQPAARIGQGSVVFRKAGRGQLDDFGLDRRRIDIIDVAMLFPEPRGLCVERIHDDEKFQLRQRVGNFLPVRERLQRVKSLAEVARHLALVHQLERPENVIGRDIHLRQPIIGEIIRRRRRVAVHGFLEADEELLVVLPVTRLARPQRLVGAGFHVGV